jgi:hypothetical protein
MSDPFTAAAACVWTMCFVVAAVAPASAADKVDVVRLKNGDRITCEIDRLDRSTLSINTDPLGKVSVHWGEIVEVTSPRQFDVQLSSGAHYLGALRASTPGQMAVALDGGAIATVPLADIIRLAPIGASIWSRVDGSVDAGFSFAQADLETHWTVNGAANYRSPQYQLSASLASQVTAREDDDPLSRNSIGLSGNRSLANRWYTIVWSQLQQNQELSLDLRVVAGGGLGRDVVHDDRRLWSIYAGAAYTHEHFSGEPADQSAEASLGSELDFFTPSSADFKITNSLLTYYSLTGRARFRLELQSAWRHEFLKDFYWSLNGFESLDSNPPANGKSNDSGISITLGWKF